MSNSGLLLSLNTAGELRDNRQWVHLLPSGMVPRVDAGRFDCTDIATIFRNTEARLNSSSTGLLVDYDHAADLAAPRGEPAIAAGWITQIERRKDGIWGLVEWTAKAAAHLANKEYRALSPVLTIDPKTPTSPWRPLAVVRAALTNTPALAGHLTALASQETPMDSTVPNDGPGAAVARAYASLKSALVAALGIDPTTEDTAIAQAVADLVAKSKAALNSATPDPAQFVPIALLQQTQAELNKLRQGVSLNAAQELVSKHIADGIILPFQRDWAVQLCQANLPSYEAYVAGVGPGFSHLRKALLPGGAPPSLNSAVSDPTITHLAGLMGFSPEELAAHHTKLHAKG